MAGGNENHQLEPENSSQTPLANGTADETAQLETKYGMPLEDMYKLALKFYREKEGKAFHASYQDKLRLVAFSKQIAHGPYVDTQDNKNVGYFDIIGNDRRNAWQSLGEIGKEVAMAGFVGLLDNVCSPFKIYLEAQKRDLDDRKRVELELQRKCTIEEEESQRLKLEEEIRKRLEQHRQLQEAQKHQIQEALNRQTLHQFREYAERQHPGDAQQQELLIQQLQDQHYTQYIEQVYAQQMSFLKQQAINDQNDPNAAETKELRDGAEAEDPSGGSEADSESEENETERDPAPSNPIIQPASMWTRKDIKEFKEAIKKEGSEGIVTVGHGETVTVRVPTHEEGTCLFWEFATDNYDIGFGVYFEWTVSESNTVSVHISESSDEEDEGESVDPKGDVEKAGVNAEKQAAKPPMDEIIPVYRRDCHEEVYAGSHVYPPGPGGVYLLKFDNSYSLWRSKKLYYRVYYSK